jgi:hypothetical protein
MASCYRRTGLPTHTLVLANAGSAQCHGRINEANAAYRDTIYNNRKSFLVLLGRTGRRNIGIIAQLEYRICDILKSDLPHRFAHQGIPSTPIVDRRTMGGCMPNRIRANRIGSTVPEWFAAALCAMLAVIVLPSDPARAAEDCLAAPNSEAPAGNHWYYRLQGAQQRHCWYLRPEGQKVHRAESEVQPTARSAASVRTETAGDRVTASPQVDPPSPPPLAAATSADARAKRTAQGAGEEAPFSLQRPDDPGQAAGAGDREAGGANKRQGVVARQDVVAGNEAAWPAAVGTANPRAAMLMWVALLVASALAVAGILHHAIFRIVVARPRIRVEPGRAERIADLAPERMPPSLTASRLSGLERAPIEPIDSQEIEDRIRQILRAMERRAA